MRALTVSVSLVLLLFGCSHAPQVKSANQLKEIAHNKKMFGLSLKERNINRATGYKIYFESVQEEKIDDLSSGPSSSKEPSSWVMPTTNRLQQTVTIKAIHCPKTSRKTEE